MTMLTPTSPYHTQSSTAPALFDLTDLENPSRHVHFVLIALLTAIAALAYGLLLLSSTDFSDAMLATYCCLYLAASLTWLFIKTLRPRPHNWLSPDIVFWLAFTMFHLPYVILYLLGMADYSHRVFYSSDAASRAMCCVLLSAVGFLVGYELGALGQEQPAQYAFPRRAPEPVFRAVHTLFIVVFLATSIALIIGIGPLVLTEGYGAIRRIEQHGIAVGTQRIVSLSLELLRVGIILYVAGSILRHRKTAGSRITATLIAGTVLFFALLGARSEAAIALTPLILAYHYFVKRIRLLVAGPVLVAMVLAFGAIGVGRRAKSISPVAIYNAYKEFRRETGVNPLVASLAEAGGTLATVNVACTYIPSVEPYWYGRSLWNSATMVIPNPIPGLRKHVAPSQWVTYRATGAVGYGRAGWGSSIAMEAYMNFGLLGGAFFMGTLGFIMRRIYDATLRRPTFVRLCLLLIAVTALALWCRNYSNHFIRPVAWTVFAAWIIWALFRGNVAHETEHIRATW